MGRLKYFFTLGLMLFVSVLFAQNNADIYQAYVHGDMKKWKNTMDMIEKQSPDNDTLKMDLLNYQYGYIEYCVKADKDDEAEAYMDKLNENIAAFEKRNYGLAYIYAYKAALIGFEIGLSPYKAPFMGSDSQGFAEKSLALDPENYLGNIQMGNIFYHKPAFFGGSNEDAIKHYKRAIELMEKDARILKNNWNYLDALLAVINVYMSQEKYSHAKQYCEKVLMVEPDFVLVKNKLYPLVLEKLKNK